MNNYLKEDEVLDSLEIDNYKIIQHNKKYKFTSDAVLLANFANIKHTDVVADLCSGSGIVGLLCSIKYKPKKVYMIEIQPDMAEMSSRSVKLNALEDNIEVINTPIQQITQIPNGSCDVVTVNPPYKKVETGKKNINMQVSISRHEISCTLSDVIECANKLLKFGGKLFMVHEANRIGEIISELSKYNFAVKKLMFTQAKINSKANLVLIQATKGGKNGTEVLPVLITNNEDGTYNHELLKYIK